MRDFRLLPYFIVLFWPSWSVAQVLSDIIGWGESIFSELVPSTDSTTLLATSETPSFSSPISLTTTDTPTVATLTTTTASATVATSSALYATLTSTDVSSSTSSSSIQQSFTSTSSFGSSVTPLSTSSLPSSITSPANIATSAHRSSTSTQAPTRNAEAGPTATAQPSNHGTDSGLIIGLAVMAAILGSLILLACVWLVCWRNRRRRRDSATESNGDDESLTESAAALTQTYHGGSNTANHRSVPPMAEQKRGYPRETNPVSPIEDNLFMSLKDYPTRDSGSSTSSTSVAAAAISEKSPLSGRAGDVHELPGSLVPPARGEKNRQKRHRRAMPSITEVNDFDFGFVQPVIRKVSRRQRPTHEMEAPHAAAGGRFSQRSEHNAGRKTIPRKPVGGGAR